MRVGLVCPYDMGKPGGVQDQVARLAGWLRGGGHTVGLVAPGEFDDPEFASVGPATVVPANGAATPVALSPKVARRVAEALDGFDVVHVHEPLMPQVSLAALRLAQQPLVGTFHADVPRAAALAYTIGRPLVGRWLRNLTVITAVSPIAARVIEHTGRVRIIPNGIDVDRYGDGDADAQSVAFLGRDDPRKGLAVLLDAWEDVRARHPEATLTVIGAEETGHPVRGVRFLGRVSEEEKRRYLAAAAIYCAPHLGGESFGIVVAEAMASRCAIVASALPAFVRVAGDAAVYTAPGDASGVAGAINDLIDHPARVAQLAQAAEMGVRRFDGATVAAEYLAAYEEAIAADRRKDGTGPPSRGSGGLRPTG
jgi:phosphatidylinositol alpha-mannosyltransferase